MSDLPTPRVFLAIFLSLMAVALVVRAAGRSFWFDEIATWEMVQLDGWSARVEALDKGADSQPPLFYTIEAAALALPLPENIALRVPSIIAFLAGAAGVYLAAALLATEWAGLAAAGVWALTVATPFALDARPYALWMGAAAWAIACFTGATKYPADRRWILGLTAALSFAVCVHYFAITLLPPLAIAGLLHDIRRKKIFWPLWLALAVAGVLFWLEIPLLLTFRTMYAPHFWTKAAGVTLTGWYLHTTLNYYPIAALALAGGAITALQVWRERAWPRWALEPSVLLLALALVPIPLRLVVDLIHFNIVPRYLVTVVPAIAILCGLASAGLVGRGRFLFAPVAILVPTIATAFIVLKPPPRWGGLQADQGPVPFRQRLLADPNLPVVASTGLDYLPWDHYEKDAGLRSRLFVLSDPGLAVRYDRTDSLELAMQLLPAAHPRQVANLTLFLSVYPRFYVILREPGYQWLERFLADQKAEVQILGTEGPWRLARVNYQYR